MTNSIGDLAEADTMFVIGSNTTEAHPVISLELIRAKREGKKLIVADPRRIDLAQRADIHLQIRPGTNVALLIGMMSQIIDSGLEDRDFISQRTEGYEEFVESVRGLTVEQAAGICGVDADDIRRAAELYARAEAANVIYAMGITQHHTGTNNVLSVANLAMLTGNIGRPGTGVNPLRGQANVQGACDMGGLPNVFSGYQKVDDPTAIEKMESAWGVVLNDRTPGRTVMEMMGGVDEGVIRGMYIMGENPILSDPDQQHVERGLKSVEFLVVQDIFLTETAEYADVVLPAGMPTEKDGTLTNTERRVQRVRKAVEPPTDTLPDWQIIQLVANRMGAGWDYTNTEEIMQEINEVTPSYGGITYERIDDLGLQWPCPSEDHEGTPILHAEEFARGKGKFSAIEWIVPAEAVDDEYQFMLTTGRELVHYHTGSLSRRAPGLDALVPKGRLEVNPDDAARLGIEQGERVRVTSRRGSIEPFAWVTDRVAPGLVFMPFHYKEAAANRLTNPVLDPVAKIPEYKVSAVKLEKIKVTA